MWSLKRNNQKRNEKTSGSRRRVGTPVYVYLRERKPERREESRALLAEVLSFYCSEMGLSTDFEIMEGEHGKPFMVRSVGGEMRPAEDVFFSVSHTRSWWLCAVCDQPIGADIEERDRSINPAVVDRFFHKQEQLYLERFGKTKERMLQIWVRKEACVKLLGRGLSKGIADFSAVDEEGFVCNIECRGERFFCSTLLAPGMRDEDGFPLPLLGAFCTRRQVPRLEIGFLGLKGDELVGEK